MYLPIAKILGRRELWRRVEGLEEVYQTPSDHDSDLSLTSAVFLYSSTVLGMRKGSVYDVLQVYQP